MTLRFRLTRVDACPVGWVPHDLRPLLDECEQSRNTVVCAVGTTERGNGVTVYLGGLLPHFYVEAPPQLCEAQLPDLLARLDQMLDGPRIRSLTLEPATAVRGPRDYDPTKRPLLRVTMREARDIAHARLLWLERHLPNGFRWQSMQFPPHVWQADEELKTGVGADLRTAVDAWVSLPAGAYVALPLPEGPPDPEHHLVLAADHRDLTIETPPPRTEPLPRSWDKPPEGVVCLYDSLAHVQDAAGVVCLLERVLRVHFGDSVDVTDRLFSPASKPPPPREPEEARWQKGAPVKPVPKAKPKGVAAVTKPKPWAVRSAAERKGKPPRGQPPLSFGGPVKRAYDDDDDL